MSQLVQDVRYALHQLLSAPGFTATAILTLALGIGANTGAFTLAYGMLLRPLPVPAPDQLYRFGDTFTCCRDGGLSSTGNYDLFPYDHYLALKKSAPQFQDLAAMQSGPNPLSVRRGNDTAKALVIAEVSGNYFRTFGAAPHLGKLFTDSDDQPGAEPVAVLNYDTWRNEFHSEPAIVGATVLIQSHPFRVLGIAQRGFFGDRVSAEPPAFWVPLASEETLDAPDVWLHQAGTEWLWLVGRVRPGTDIQALQKSLSDTTRQWLTSTQGAVSAIDKRKIPKQHIVLVPVPHGIPTLANYYRPALKLLLILSSVVLLIACANIVNLLLARGIARRPELALRIALGGSRGRILRQIFTENLLLSCIGGIVALVISFAGSYLTLRLGFPDATTMPVPVTPSLPVLGFAFLVSLVSGILFGAAPARLALLAQPTQVMHGSLHSARSLSLLPQKSLLVLQAALSLVLLTVAGSASRSLYNLGHQQMGFDTANRYVVQFDPQHAGYTPDRWPELYGQIESDFSKLGGVSHVGLVALSPFGGFVDADCILIEPPGSKSQLNTGPRQCDLYFNQANAAYLDSMGGILQGRNFSKKDTATSSPVAIVSQSFAQRFFRNQNPIGRRFRGDRNASSPIWEIVGVVPDIKFQADEPVAPTYYLPITQPWQEGIPVPMTAIVLRFNRPPDDAEGILRRTMGRVDPNLPILGLYTMDSLIAGSLSEPRVIAWLSIVFGVLAIALASVGLYGVTSYIVAQRINEIGIRMALGSTRSGVIRLILRSVLTPVALGLALGIPSSLLAGYSIKDLLYQLSWHEPLGLVIAVLLLVLCAIAAVFIPARRAASIQPMQALRVE